ncbi:MAG TPA: NUDIX domain-containing protein [Phycisphaerae bacterium]|nr:NUDIX domain-containing protein [Phycisphaerae bacterium]
MARRPRPGALVVTGKRQGIPRYLHGPGMVVPRLRCLQPCHRTFRAREVGGDIAHLIVGGRPEPGEGPEETLVREIAEESGWRVTPRGLVGLRHFHHLGPLTPSMSDRPYTDFLQPIYAAVAETHDPSLLLPDEPPCRFVDAAWARQVTRPEHRPLLAAALELRGAM